MFNFFCTILEWCLGAGDMASSAWRPTQLPCLALYEPQRTASNNSLWEARPRVRTSSSSSLSQPELQDAYMYQQSKDSSHHANQFNKTCFVFKTKFLCIALAVPELGSVDQAGLQLRDLLISVMSAGIKRNAPPLPGTKLFLYLDLKCLCVWVFSCMCVCAPCARLMLMDTRKHWIPRNKSQRWLWVTMWVLGIKPRASERGKAIFFNRNPTGK